jgi:hypothetical protein
MTCFKEIIRLQKQPKMQQQFIPFKKNNRSYILAIMPRMLMSSNAASIRHKPSLATSMKKAAGLSTIAGKCEFEKWL